MLGLSAQANNWTFSRDVNTILRGGTSIGVPVTYENETPKSWINLKEEGISDYERDRRAIYALEGEFEVSFEFLETILLETNKDWDVPYASKGTEFVKVIEDRGDFISLQHIMVLFMKNPETGEEMGPMLVKHWRQDWKWEPKERFEFQGDRTWKVKNIKRRDRKNVWRWDVYQVDDSPRYSGLGEWTHLKSASTFSTNYMSRPLPRREFSVRDDYKVLLGTDTLVVTPKAWYHEQRNFKHETSLGEEGSFKESNLLAREIGHNSYIRIKDFNFSSGYDYWENTKGYWSDVRAVWNEILDDEEEFKLHKKVDGKALHFHHFEQAENPEVQTMSSKKRKVLIKDLLNKFLIK
jgi:hypothetical protein